MTFKYVPLNPYRLHLRLMAHDAVFSTLGRTLEPLGSAIRDCSVRIHEAHESGSEDYAEVVTDEEVEIIESLLGAAFVVCQAHVNAIVTRIKGIHRAFRTHQGRLLKLSDNRDAVLCCGTTPSESGAYPAPQIVDAFANFFKHGDEWPHHWGQLNDQQKRAGAVLLAVGATAGSTGNLRAGAAALGNANFQDVQRFATHLENWRAALVAVYEDELRSEGVI
jgi:hypothetical protein